METCKPDTQIVHTAPKPRPAPVTAVICRICDHVEENPLDTWRCPACLHTNTMDKLDTGVRS